MKKHIMLVAFAVSSLCGRAQFWNDTGNPAIIPGTNFLGTLNSAPLDFHTDNVFRARINPKLTYSFLNTFPNIPADGFMLITPDNGFLGQAPKGPFSRLHLAEGGHSGNAEQWGYRPWQRNGITFTGNEDQGYVGQKYREGGSGYTDMVMQWSDNPGNWKGDRLRFIFTSGYNPGSPTGMNSLEGLEGMRLYPDEHDFINVGIGDFFAGGDDPTERLDVRTGRVRIRQLPTDAIAPTLTKFLVVDDTPGPDFGVVKWRNVPVGTGGGCEWTLLGPAGSNSDVATAYLGNPGCPQVDKSVMIGTNYPYGKLAVTCKGSQYSKPIGVFVSMERDDTNWVTGLQSSVKPETGTSSYQVAVKGQATNGTVSNTGVYGVGAMTTGSSAFNAGVQGYSNTVNSNVTAGYGGYFVSSIGTGGTVTKNYGVRAQAFGNGSGTNFGVWASASGLPGSSNWAGWFQGDLHVAGIATVPGNIWTPSDESLKAGITDISDALHVLGQLHPKFYDYRVDEYPQASLPTGQQYGFLAQELEQVIPEAVKEYTFPAELDSMGHEINAALSTKVVNTAMVIPFLVAAVNEQQATIAHLQDQVNNCCAAQGGMAPECRTEQKMASQGNDLQEQRLLIIPNPVADFTTLEYYVPKAGKVSLSISTSDGKPLGTLREEQAEPGAYSYQWNTTKLSAGTYFCTYLLDDAVVVKQAVKVK